MKNRELGEGDERESLAKIKYSGKLFEVVSEPVLVEGKTIEFEKVRRSPGARLILSDGQGNILLTREFRRELGAFDYRLPGGKVFDSLDEFHEFEQNGGDIVQQARVAAIKEAKEETGFVPETLEHYSTSKLGATVEWDLHYFAGIVDRSNQRQQELEAGETIDVVWFSEDEVRQLILERAAFSEERSVVALMRFLHDKERMAKVEIAGDGSRLVELLQANHLDSVRVRLENLKKMKEFTDVIFVGSSLVGKTTLVDVLRERLKVDPILAGKLEIPKRVITRPQRENDNLDENQFVTADEFNEMVRKGDIGLHWVRKMEGDREERYGFLSGNKDKIHIFSGNNAIINNKDSIVPSGSSLHTLMIGVYTPDDLRLDRMKQRSPDLLIEKPEEAKYRLADRAINVYPEAHLVVKNYDRYQDVAKQDIVSLFTMIAKLKS